MPVKVTVAAGIVLLFYASIDSARAFHICGPHNVIRINMFNLQCASASGTAVRQPCLTWPTPSRAPFFCDVSVRSRRCRVQQGPWRSASLLKMLAYTPPSTAALQTESVSSSTVTRKPPSSNRTYSRHTWQPSSIPEMSAPTAPSLASTTAESVLPSTATTKPSSPSRTYTRYAWQPSSSRSSGSGDGGKGSAPGTSADPKLDVFSQPLPVSSSPLSTDSDVAPPPVAGGAASAASAAPGASKAPVALGHNEDLATRDMESMLQRAKEILTPFLRKIQDNIAEGNLGERGEEWAVAQALILLFVALNSIPVLGGIVLLLAGPGLLVGGVVTSAVGVVQLGESLSPWPAPTKENYLKTDGIFGLVRHPTYCGLIMFCFGLGVTTSSPTRILLATLLAVIIDKKTIKEEDMLVKVHGTAYEDYRNTVAKFVPRYY